MDKAKRDRIVVGIIMFVLSTSMLSYMLMSAGYCSNGHGSSFSSCFSSFHLIPLLIVILVWAVIISGVAVLSD